MGKGKSFVPQRNLWQMLMAAFMLVTVMLCIIWGWGSTLVGAATCSSASWAAATVYVEDDTVVHNGYEWRAKWWTQGEEPGTTGQWGVWEQLGSCDGNSTPTATTLPTVTVLPTNTSLPPTSTTQPTTSPTDQPTVTPTQTTSTCTLPSWQAAVAYNGGDQVSHAGYEWRAKWWSQGEEPGTTGEWGAWEQLGSCGGTPEPTATVLPTNTPLPPTASPTIAPTVTDEPTAVPTATGEPTVAPTATTEPTIAPTVTGEPTIVPTPTATPPTGGHEACRPEGLYQTPGVDVPYCTVYDQNGREVMGNDHPRRIIGYFTSWRNGANGQPTYLVTDIPWGSITHINYAFAHVDSQNRLSIGDAADPNNPATGMTWPTVAGAQMDPTLPYQGHFNLLTQYKQQYPEVKTLISVGGWAETGGHFGSNGDRVNDGGFYAMTTNPDGSVNTAGIDAFADSAVDFVRTYDFDGVDIDYEYPTSMTGAGNPMDFAYADPLRPYLMNSYVELMKTLRQRLDQAGAADGQHYMLTIAAPSSGYLLRGMETFQVVQYLDYINIMTYDLHGAWNDHVGHNAALYDTGLDGELTAANVYGTAQYGGIGYLNTDWAYHYFRGSVPAGRINIGIPYYTRGWQGVSGGNNGLWGRAALPDQTQCPSGTGQGENNNCGYGAIGIDNMWHDLDENGIEMGAGSNPMWHAKNLENGIVPSYLSDYGLDPANDPQDQFVGVYSRHYDAVAESPWLWNDQKDVFLSIEDEQSMTAKVQYVIDEEVGGIMFWELAGDYTWHSDRNGGNGEYYMGYTLTELAYNMMSSASPYGNAQTDRVMPSEAVDITVVVEGFKVGDQNYPINPKLKITNNSGVDLAGGTTFEFDIPTSTPDNAKDQSGAGLSVIESGHTASNNVGGLQGDFHRVSFSLPNWQTLANGDTYELDFVYYLPISGPANYTVQINGTTYVLAFEYPGAPLADLSSGGGGGGGTTCADIGVDVTTINVYPAWPQGDHATGGDQIRYNGTVYQANWWTNSIPGSDGSWAFICNEA